MDNQVEQTESAEDSVQKTYVVIDRYGVVELSDKKYYIKD